VRCREYFDILKRSDVTHECDEREAKREDRLTYFAIAKGRASLRCAAKNHLKLILYDGRCYKYNDEKKSYSDFVLMKSLSDWM